MRDFLLFLRRAALAAAVAAFFACATGGKDAPKSEREHAGDVTIIAVGDNLIHKELIAEAAREDGRFDFEPYYRELRGVVKNADIAFINQETLIAGAAAGYSGYPLFNGPQEIGDALVKTGFNVVNHASNHTMDRDGQAVLDVIAYWKTKKGVTVLGIHESEAARKTPWRIIEVKGLRFGFLAYTYGLNGRALPDDMPYLVSLIDTGVMAREIDALRSRCDFLVVSMHWGAEYKHTPNTRQEELAAFLAAHNVDLVIGHHPHVLQPARLLTRPDGGQTLCFFSLGNFISAQSEHPRMLGGLMRVTVSKEARITRAQLIPLVTHYEHGFKNFKVYLLDNYHGELAETHALNRAKTPLNKKYFQDLFVTIRSSSTLFD